MLHGRTLKRHTGGFTLVEILVVMVIIAILAAGAILSLSVLGQDRELEDETSRLVLLMNYAREQAELQTRELGLYCTERGYRFLAFDPLRNLWVDLAEDDALHPRELPEGLSLSLSIEAHDVVLSKSMDDDKFKKQAEAIQKAADAAAEAGLGVGSPAGIGGTPGAAGAAIPLDAGSHTLGGGADNPIQPHIMIFSNGDLTSFELTLTRADSSRHSVIAPDDQQRVKIKQAVTGATP